MLRRNVSGQFIGFAGIDASSGAAMTGTTGFAAYRVIDGGAQAAATGTVTDKTHGQYSFALSQADTNGNIVSVLFAMTGMVPVEKTFVTTAADPTSASNFGLTNLDAPISGRAAPGDTMKLSVGTGTGQVNASGGKVPIVFPTLDLTGQVAASPSPSATSLTVTLDAAVGAGTVAADFVGLYLTFTSGNRLPVPGKVASAVLNSTTSVALTFAAGTFAAAPAATDTVLISG